MEAFLCGRKALQQFLIYELHPLSKGKYRLIHQKPEMTGPSPSSGGFQGLRHMSGGPGPGQKRAAGSLVFLTESLGPWPSRCHPDPTTSADMTGVLSNKCKPSGAQDRPPSAPTHCT